MSDRTSINPEIINTYVSSDRELYYTICCFLIKNRITSGCIYSNKKEILDGLGDYMTSIRVPWTYEKSIARNVGYSFIDGTIDSCLEGLDTAIFFDGEETVRKRLIVGTPTF